MPVIVDPDSTTARSLLGALPSGCQSVDTTERLLPWLAQHPEEYVVVLGPNISFGDGVTVCEALRISRPATSVVFVRPALDTGLLARAMQAGAREVVAMDDLHLVAGAVTRAHEFSQALRGPEALKKSGQVISIFSPKGGVGKTTVAVNLALALSGKGARKVCLVDFDLAFGDVAITLQLFPSHTIEHAIGSEEDLDAALLSSLLTRYQDSLKVLAAPSHPDVRERITPLLISKVLRTLRTMYDYVIVDTAPAFDEPTLTALDETDECIVVATLDVPTLKNVKVALDTLEMLNVGRGHRYLLLNHADDAVGIGAEKVETILGMSVSSRISTSVDIAAATNAGTPIVAASPNHPSSSAFRSLSALLAGEPLTGVNGDSGRHAETNGKDGRAKLFRIKR
ncbi:MAG: AAA family ATPase [Nocardioides sp.]|nr:AAA family ATPase [Nocardioides sp.]